MARHAGVERRSLEAQAADVLRDRIVSGIFSPGDRLTEERLADAARASVRRQSAQRRRNDASETNGESDRCT
jgi:DNA-binding GntR family transcriptional regulator